MIRQTSCKHCGQDIENFSPYKRGEWRDRGNNTHCPTPEGNAGQMHEPYIQAVVADVTRSARPSDYLNSSERWLKRHRAEVQAGKDQRKFWIQCTMARHELENDEGGQAYDKAEGRAQ